MGKPLGSRVRAGAVQRWGGAGRGLLWSNLGRWQEGVIIDPGPGSGPDGVLQADQNPPTEIVDKFVCKSTIRRAKPRRSGHASIR
jgi:hypothetical protein